MFEPYIPDEDDQINLPGRKDVEITEEDLLKNICNCQPCTHLVKDVSGNPRESRISTFCEKYVPRLIEFHKVGEPVKNESGDFFYPVMGGFVPKNLVDRYSDDIIERLKTLNKQDRDEFNDHFRPFYTIDHFEDDRRMLHIAILYNAGFYPEESTIEAEAFKIVIEKFIEERCRRLGLIE